MARIGRKRIKQEEIIEETNSTKVDENIEILPKVKVEAEKPAETITKEENKKISKEVKKVSKVQSLDEFFI